jgi:tol-pal system protein YbgF
MGAESARGNGLLAVTPRATGFCVACLAVVALAGCASTPPEEDPVQIKLNDLDTRLTRLERVMANQSLLDLSNQLEALRSDVRGMHNDVDELSHNLDANRKQQHDLYVDLDQRIKTLESRAGSSAAASPGSAAGAPGAAASANPPAADGSDKASYQTAFDLLKNSQFDAAIAGFQKFLVSFPDSALADNAQYWLGEAYYVNRSFPEAQGAFQRVVDKYPDSRKVPDAMLKIGYCDYELKQWDAAKNVLTAVVTSYPDSPSGHLAQQRLDKMAAEKH